MNVNAHRTKWTLVLRGGALPPGEHVERFTDKTAMGLRISTARADAARKGDPLVTRIIPPKGITG